MSAIPPKADKLRADRFVRFVPLAAICTAANSILIRSPRRRGERGRYGPISTPSSRFENGSRYFDLNVSPAI